ncbi:MAG: NAD-dependent protein deacylase [Deltaproteobacteria bacterium]|nr:NAD-dependent protein deacylase [Deltaproteobacteria bacterium]
MHQDSIEAAAEIIAKANYAVAFTGAGISAESGIPTFRDPGGIWDRFDPGELGTAGGAMQFAQRHPERIREFLIESVATFEKAEPNPAHHGLAELEKMEILQGVVTQNIDDLHSMAGNTRVFEVHGNLYRFRCTSCGVVQKFSRQEILSRVKRALSEEPFSMQTLLAALPQCDCQGLMRPDVVMFGEAVQQVPESYREAQLSDVIIVLGTSGVVWPAAGVPYEAKKTDSKIIEINPSENAFRDITDVYVKDLSGAAMPKIIERVRNLR